jgi:hypothetical protein
MQEAAIVDDIGAVNDHTWSLYKNGLISREQLLASLGKSQDLTLHTETDKGWCDGAFCDIVMFGYGMSLRFSDFERIDFYPDFTQIWSDGVKNDEMVTVLPRWMASEL